MSIHIGDRKIAAIYKGDRKIAKVYKGDTLMYSSARLPKEYVELEYIESTGTQYIDTGTIPANVGNNFKILIELSDVNSGRFGCQRYNHRTTDYWCLCPNFAYSNNNLSIQCGSGASEVVIQHSGDDTKHLYGIDVKNKQYIYDSDTYSESAIIVDYAIDNFYLFADNYNEEAVHFTSNKLYSCKIFDNNSLIRNFIPCYRKLDMKPGLYDIVNNQFYVNQGTGEFLYKRPLPSIYQQIEYIESTGTQWIDTNIKADTISKIETMAKNTFIGTFVDYHYNGLIGGGYSSDFTTFQIIHNQEAHTIVPRWNTSTTLINEDDIWHYFLLSNTYIGIDDTRIQVTNDTIVDDRTVVVFARKNDTNASQIDVVKNEGWWACKYFKIYNISGALVRDFIPCYRKSDNEIGLYDLVTKTFFTNQGTGTFLKGPDVN